MVVVTKHLLERTMVQRVIMSFDVPEEVLLQSEQSNPNGNWLGVIYALDRVFLSHGGAMGQHRFLHERLPVLEGRTPIEALALPEGLDRFCRAATLFADCGM
jgi:hypothetical protein